MNCCEILHNKRNSVFFKVVPKNRFSSKFYSRLNGLFGTDVNKCKISILGFFNNVSLKITGGALNKVKVWPELAASFHEE